MIYHRVFKENPSLLCDNAMYVTAKTLDMHIRELSDFFDIVSLDSILARDKGNKRLCAITFDDGWSDNYEYAFPVLKKYNVPATIFIPVGIIGTKKRFWFQSVWDIALQSMEHGLQMDFIRHFNAIIPAWKAKDINEIQICDLIAQLKSLPAEKLDDLTERTYISLGLTPKSDRYILNWEQIREMSSNRITFGPHGLNHYILTNINYEMKKKEIFDSFRILNEKGVSVSPFFSFPNGEWDGESLALVKEAGYKGVMTTHPGYNVSRINPFLLNRVAVHDEVSNTPYLLWFRIFQAFNPLHRL